MSNDKAKQTVSLPVGTGSINFTSSISPVVYTWTHSSVSITTNGKTTVTYELDSSWPPNSYIAGYYDNSPISTLNENNYGYTLSGTSAKDNLSYEITVNPKAGDVTVKFVLVILVAGNSNSVTLYDPQDTEVPV